MTTWATTGELATAHADLMAALYDLDNLTPAQAHTATRHAHAVNLVIIAYRRYHRLLRQDDPGSQAE